jgi:hypothetical protein
MLPEAVHQLSGSTSHWPMEIRALVAKLQQRGLVSGNRRKSVRHPFLFEATVRYTGTDLTHTKATVYTRDRNDTCIAFLADTRLAVGQYAVLDFTGTQEAAALGCIACRVMRCRQFHDGWFECVVQLGSDAPAPTSAWRSLCNWLGEATGFGGNPKRSDFPIAGAR